MWTFKPSNLKRGLLDYNLPIGPGIIPKFGQTQKSAKLRLTLARLWPNWKNQSSTNWNSEISSKNTFLTETKQNFNSKTKKRPKGNIFFNRIKTQASRIRNARSTSFEEMNTGATGSGVGQEGGEWGRWNKRLTFFQLESNSSESSFFSWFRAQCQPCLSVCLSDISTYLCRWHLWSLSTWRLRGSRQLCTDLLFNGTVVRHFYLDKVRVCSGICHTFLTLLVRLFGNVCQSLQASALHRKSSNVSAACQQRYNAITRCY